MPKKDGLLVVISGPAGSGKTTLVNNLMARHSEIRRAVTATSRKPRPGEVHGKDYYFHTREEFEAMINSCQLLEYTTFNGNYYGIPREHLELNVAKGGVVLLVIEVDGAESIKFFFPDAIFIFIIPPTPAELRRRLRGRGTESPEDVENRLAIATREMQRISEYDFLIINDDSETATLDLLAVIRAVERSLIFGNETIAWEDGKYSGWSMRRFL